MSAEVLRRAASLMRERAEAASHWEPAAWFATQGAVYGGTAAPHQVITPLTTYDGDAEHIASWHPAVALAVADWLDAVVPFFEQFYDGGDHPALAVARAYLGESA